MTGPTTATTIPSLTATIPPPRAATTMRSILMAISTAMANSLRPVTTLIGSVARPPITPALTQIARIKIVIAPQTTAGLTNRLTTHVTTNKVGSLLKATPLAKTTPAKSARISPIGRLPVTTQIARPTTTARMGVADPRQTGPQWSPPHPPLVGPPLVGLPPVGLRLTAHNTAAAEEALRRRNQANQDPTLLQEALRPARQELLCPRDRSARSALPPKVEIFIGHSMPPGLAQPFTHKSYTAK
jgi:hypothetical protein